MSNPAFNLKLPIKISKKQRDKLVQYAKDCGYPVEVKSWPDAEEFSIDHPQYDCTPLAESVMNGETHRWEHFAYIRL